LASIPFEILPARAELPQYHIKPTPPKTDI
jgi:hypothetical protein